MKEFDLELAKAGYPVCTRDGRSARVICYDCKHPIYPLIGLVGCKNGEEYVLSYTEKGELIEGLTYGADLMMANVKKEGWINIYKGGRTLHDIGITERTGVCIFNTKEEAINNSQGVRVDTIKIEYEL